MKIALVVGHKKNSKGACGIECEFDYNESLIKSILPQLNKKIKAKVIYRKSYHDLPYEINEINPDYILSFHCNAFNTMATGSEVLYYYKSQKGRILAEIMLNSIVTSLELPNRGIKPKSTEQRGGYLLRYTDAPCVILEPFFIDNNSDYITAIEREDVLIHNIARAINSLYEGMC